MCVNQLAAVVSTALPDWFIPWGDVLIDIFDEIGRGGFGRVFRGEWLNTEVVVKKSISKLIQTKACTCFDGKRTSGTL
jgi:hypothetical protein